MHPQSLRKRQPVAYDSRANVIYLTGPCDDVVVEQGPRTPVLEFAHRLPRLFWKAFVIGFCLGGGLVCLWFFVEIVADAVKAVAHG